jgi:hypothetical protein
MPSKKKDKKIDYTKLRHEALVAHDPDLEPFASMTAQELVDLLAEALPDQRRAFMLERFIEDKLTPAQFNAWQISRELRRWFLERYADEYPHLLRPGSTHLATAVAIFGLFLQYDDLTAD